MTGVQTCALPIWDELKPEEAAIIETHLRECSACSALLAGWGALPEVSNSISALSTEQFVKRVMRNVPEKRTSWLSMFFDVWYPYCALTASAVLWAVFLTGPSPAPTTDSPLFGGYSQQTFEQALQGGSVSLEDVF